MQLFIVSDEDLASDPNSKSNTQRRLKRRQSISAASRFQAAAMTPKGFHQDSRNTSFRKRSPLFKRTERPKSMEFRNLLN